MHTNKTGKDMKGKRLWQGRSDRICGYVQIAESESGDFYIRGSSYSSSGGAIKHKPRFERWVKLNKKHINPQRKFSTPRLQIYGKCTLSQIGGACRLRLPS